MQGDYLSALVFGIIGLGFTLLFLLLSKLVRPKKKSPLKYTTYECGEKPEGSARLVSFQYYIFAILFIVFDVISVFLYLWAVAYTRLPSLVTLQIYIFVLALCTAVFYSLRTEGRVLS